MAQQRRPPAARLGRVVTRLSTMTVVATAMGVLVAGLALPVVGLAWFTTGLAAEGMQKLPLQLSTAPLTQRSRVLDRHDRLVTTFYEKNRVMVELADIAPAMRDAVIAIEDTRFYEHDGLDVEGTLRAFVANTTTGRTRQGGSTITQQLVKITALEQATTVTERRMATANTYARKLTELRYARWLEQEYGKDWILERYLNTAYFGDGAYGVEAAAEHYFSRHASELELHEAALLAGLVKNPNGFDPVRYPQRALDRRNVTLRRMADTGHISRAEARQARARDLGLRLTTVRRGCVSARASFFCDYVREYLLREPTLGETRSERLELLRTGGLTIKTTMDRRMQRAARKSVRAHVFPKDQAIGAIAMVQPGTGNVRALAQSRPMGRDGREGQTFLNYLVPTKYGDANGFQAGSTFKVFVLAAAISQGIPLRTKIESPPELTVPVSRYRGCRGRLISDDVWKPNNSTGSGTFDLYTGTQRSVNTFFAQLELRTGLCSPYRLARKMGVHLTDRHNQQVPSFTLGVVNTDPLTMAEAYATFAARGVHCASRPVTQVLDTDGSALLKIPKRCDRVLRPPVADAVNDILRGVQEPGGFGHGAGLALRQPSAGKTGTIDGNKAVWFIGYTPNLAAASMIAGANRKGHWQTLNGQVVGGERISSAAGSTTAGPMWGDAMKRVQQWLPNKDFVRPGPSVAVKPEERIPGAAPRSDARPP